MTETNESRVVHIVTKKNPQDNLVRHIATITGTDATVDREIDTFGGSGSYVIFEAATAEDFSGGKIEAKLDQQLFEGVPSLSTYQQRAIPTVLHDRGIHTTSDVARLGRIPLALVMWGKLEPKHTALVMALTRRATGRAIRDWPLKDGQPKR